MNRFSRTALLLIAIAVCASNCCAARASSRTVFNPKSNVNSAVNTLNSGPEEAAIYGENEASAVESID